MNTTNNRLKSLIVAAIALVAVIVVTALINLASHSGMVGIKVVALPNDSTITLDGKKVSAGKLYMKPGQHTLKATRQYFDPVTKTVNVQKNSSSGTIYLLPIANSAQAQQWLAQHPDVQAQREAISGESAEQDHQDLSTKNPIISKLPVYNSEYRIDYSINNDNSLAFTITTYAILNQPSQYQQYLTNTQAYRAKALKFLSDNGVNTAKVKITYAPTDAELNGTASPAPAPSPTTGGFGDN